MLGPTPPVAAQAMLTVLSMLPKDSKLGHKTADGFFVPLNLNNLRVEHGAAERVVPAATVNPSQVHSASFPSRTSPHGMKLFRVVELWALEPKRFGMLPFCELFSSCTVSVG